MALLNPVPGALLTQPLRLSGMLATWGVVPRLASGGLPAGGARRCCRHGASCPGSFQQVKPCTYITARHTAWDGPHMPAFVTMGLWPMHVWQDGVHFAVGGSTYPGVVGAFLSLSAARCSRITSTLLRAKHLTPQHTITGPEQGMPCFWLSTALSCRPVGSGLQLTLL